MKIWPFFLRCCYLDFFFFLFLLLPATLGLTTEPLLLRTHFQRVGAPLTAPSNLDTICPERASHATSLGLQSRKTALPLHLGF